MRKFLKLNAPMIMLWRYSITLAAFAVGSTSLIVIVQLLTAPVIQQHTQAQQRATLDQLLPPASYDNNLLQACYLVTDPLLGSDHPQRLYVAQRRGEAVAVVVATTSANGYAGTIKLLVASDLQGKILGVRVVAHHETPGLGDKIEKKRSNWIDVFAGKQVINQHDIRWNVRKAGGDFDQLSGATITSQAVIKSVEQTVQYLLRHHHQFTPPTSLTRCPQAS